MDGKVTSHHFKGKKNMPRKKLKFKKCWNSFLKNKSAKKSI